MRYVLLWYVLYFKPSKHNTVIQYRFNVGPASWTMGQHCPAIGKTSCVCWDTQKLSCDHDRLIIGETLAHLLSDAGTLSLSLAAKCSQLLYALQKTRLLNLLNWMLNQPWRITYTSYSTVLISTQRTLQTHCSMYVSEFTRQEPAYFSRINNRYYMYYSKICTEIWLFLLIRYRFVSVIRYMYHAVIVKVTKLHELMFFG